MLSPFENMDLKHRMYPGRLLSDRTKAVSIRLGGSKIPLTSSLLRYFEKFKFSITVLPSLHAKSLQSGPTLCDPIDSSPPGSSVHRIL